MTLMIVILNVLLFFFEMSLGDYLEEFLLVFGFVPARYYQIVEQGPQNWLALFLPMFSSMFLHGGWIHLIGNMWILWIFGDNVEDRMGHLRFLFFYLLCGIGAVYTQLWADPWSKMPMIGASGAISGVMGAYLLLYPRARVLTLFPILFFFTFLEVPAFFFLGYWFLLQFFSGALTLTLSERWVGGVAWWAHIGGFVSGMILVWFFKKWKTQRIK
jgi:membrane associated rhomboid family serine protease